MKKSSGRLPSDNQVVNHYFINQSTGDVLVDNNTNGLHLRNSDYVEVSEMMYRRMVLVKDAIEKVDAVLSKVGLREVYRQLEKDDGDEHETMIYNQVTHEYVFVKRRSPPVLVRAGLFFKDGGWNEIIVKDGSIKISKVLNVDTSWYSGAQRAYHLREILLNYLIPPLQLDIGELEDELVGFKFTDGGCVVDFLGVWYCVSPIPFPLTSVPHQVELTVIPPKGLINQISSHAFLIRLRELFHASKI